MKYYEVVSNSFCFYLKGKIYPENYKQSEYCNNIGLHAKHCPSVFREVPAGEYFVQEGIMPKYFAIKKVEDNPLWGKYIDWLSNTYSNNLIGCADQYYGFDDIVSIYPKLKYFKNNPVELTLEQWDKIINKKEEIMDKEIIGWKLKEDCEQYESAALKLVNSSRFYSFAEGYNFAINSENESSLKKAGVLELWFEPVYKEEFKIGNWIYIINTGTSVTCPLTDTGKEHHGAKRCDVVKIEGITYKDGNANIKDPRYYGKNWNLRTESFRKATPEEIEAAQYPQITINNYKGEFFDNFVKFGCAKIDKNWFLQFYEIMRTVTYSNKEIESVTIGKGTFTKDQIKEIAAFYLNKK